MMLRLRGGGHKSNPWKKAHSKMRWKWKKKRTRRLQRKRRSVPPLHRHTTTTARMTAPLPPALARSPADLAPPIRLLRLAGRCVSAPSKCAASIGRIAGPVRPRTRAASPGGVRHTATTTRRGPATVYTSTPALHYLESVEVQ